MFPEALREMKLDEAMYPTLMDAVEERISSAVPQHLALFTVVGLVAQGRRWRQMKQLCDVVAEHVSSCYCS